MERQQIPLHKWLMAFYLMSASKKGVQPISFTARSALTYKSAWFMCHRIREAMRDGGLAPLGGGARSLKPTKPILARPGEAAMLKPRAVPYTKGGRSDRRGKRAIVALVERGGNVRTFHVAHADKINVTKIVRDNIASESRLHTDESRLYDNSDEHFEAHETVKHSAGEYVRGDVHTNSVEGYFSIFKRGMRGIYQHCGEKHLASLSWRNSTFATIIARRLAIATLTGPLQRSKASAASASCIINLVKPTFRFKAARFLRWRKKLPKRKRPKKKVLPKI